jgi:hypothetical protein
MDIVCVGYIGHGMLPTGLNRSRYVALTGLNRSRYVAHGIDSDSAARAKFHTLRRAFKASTCA